MSLVDMVFGCWHKRCSFPITVRGKLLRTTRFIREGVQGGLWSSQIT